jgi:hypothetical protein
VGQGVSSNVGAGLTKLLDESMGALATRTLSGIAAGAAATAMRGGRVVVNQVATDAFGNALGSSIAESATAQQQRREAEYSANIDRDDLELGRALMRNEQLAEQKRISAATLAALVDAFGKPSGLRAEPDQLARTTVNGKRVDIAPEDKSVPSISIPNNAGARGVSPNDLNFHVYDVRTQAGIIDPTAVGSGIARLPVPPGGQPASPEGTLNNAGAIPTAGSSNYVRSYLIPSPDPARYTDITVNYTVTGAHGLTEGYVMRYGEISSDGTTLRSYGEGNAWRQSPILKPLWSGQVDKVWQENQRIIIDRIKAGK